MQGRARGWRTHRWVPASGQQPLDAAAPNAAAPRAWRGTAQQILSWKPWEHVGFSLAMLGAILYVFQIHSYKLPVGNIPTALALIGVVLERQFRIDRTFLFSGLLVIWAVTLSWTLGIQWPTVSRTDAESFAKVWLISWAIFVTLRDRYRVRLFVFAWLALFALYPLRGAYFNQFICHCATYGRISWNFAFENPNDLAAYCMMPIGMCAGVLVTERSKVWRVSALVGLAALLLLVLLTQSRGAFLALAALGLLVLIRAPNRARNFRIAAVAALLAIPFAPSGVWDRIAGLRNFSTESNMSDVDEDGSAQGRWRGWVIATTVIRDYPVTGVGPGMYPFEHWRRARRENEVKVARGARDAHSTYLLLGAELGLVGLGLFLLTIGSALRAANRARRLAATFDPRAAEQLLFLEFGFIGFLMAGIFGSYGYLGYMYVYLAIIVAFSRALVARAKGTAPQIASSRVTHVRSAAGPPRAATVRAWPSSR